MIQKPDTQFEPATDTETLTADAEGKLLLQLAWSTRTWKAERRMHRNLTIANVLLETGIRVNELVQLRIPDLWFADTPVSTLIVRKEIAKGKRERRIPVSPRLCEILVHNHKNNWAFDNSYPNGYAFYVTCPTKPLTTRSVQRLIVDAAKAALNMRVTPHTLRHTFASRVLEKSNLEVVRRLLGHSSILTTQRYVHASADQLKMAVEAASRKD